MKNTITLKMVSEDTAILQRNAQDMICPMMPPITMRQKVSHPLYGVQEQIQVQKSPCNSNCPLFDIQDNSKVIIKCGGSDMLYQIEETLPFVNPENSNVSEPTNDKVKFLNLNNQTTT